MSIAKKEPNSQLISTFYAWKLKPSEKAAILGRRSPPRLQTQRLKKSEDLEERIKLILEIEQLLNSQGCADQASWIRTRNKSLQWLTPLEYMLNFKISGMLTIRQSMFRPNWLSLATMPRADGNFLEERPTIIVNEGRYTL